MTIENATNYAANIRFPEAGAAKTATGATDIAGIDKAFADMLGGNDDPEEMLKNITQDGIKSMWKWQIKELEKKVAAKVMAAHNLTPEKLAAMAPNERAEIEKKIMEEVARIIKQTIDEQAKREQKNDLGVASGGMDSATMQALLGAL